MERTEPLGVRVPPELKAKVIAAARQEDRSLASLVERILREWLSKNDGNRRVMSELQVPDVPHDEELHQILQKFSITMTYDDLMDRLGDEAQIITDAGFVLVPRSWREDAMKALRQGGAS